MSFAPSTPVTGATVTGLTSPTYTIAADLAPSANSKQYAVTNLGGTQTGVTTHSVASPFTGTIFRPANYRTLGSPNPVTGLIAQVPRNPLKVVTRKGVTPLAAQPIQVQTIDTTIGVVAGSEVADPLNAKAGLSFHIGLLDQVSAGLSDTMINGVI
jgi:hypothetical protein